MATAGRLTIAAFEQMTKEDRNAPRLGWIGLALAALTIALYSPVFHYDFLTFDDQIYVTENPYVRSGLNSNSLAWAFQTSTSGNWIPVTWISHMLDIACYGARAGGHHATNVLIHAANVVLLFLLLRNLTGAIWKSALVAALFAWHPAHVESVAWVAERKDVLSSFFGLLSLLAYTQYARNLKSHTSDFKWWYGAALLLFTCGLMAKSMLVTLPFVMLLLDWWPLGRMTRPAWPRLFVEKTPWLVLSIACCVVTVWAQQRSSAVASAAEISVGHRLVHALASYFDYLLMLVFPHGLAIFYPYPNRENALHVEGGAVALMAISLTALVLARKKPWLAAGWFWFLGMLVPVIGLVQVGDQAMADRYTYLPSIGIFIVVVWWGGEWAMRIPAVKWMAPLVLLLLLTATWRQIHFWRDTKTVFERAVDVTQDNYLALSLLGSLRTEQGDVDGGMELYRQALTVKPGYAKAHFFLAHALELQGKTNEAVKEYETSLRLSPSFEPAHIFLGVLLGKEKLYDQAAAQYEEVLKMNPRSATAHNDLAHILQTEGRLDESAAHYLAAIKYDSSLAQAHNNLGVLYLQKGQLAEAAAQLREALRLSPGNAETEYNLGVALNDGQQWSEAAALFQRGATQESNNAVAQYQYGLALAHLGRTREAMARYARALLLTPDYPEALDALAWIAATAARAEFRNPPQAAALAERACELTHRRQPEMLLTLAAAAAANGRFQDAAPILAQGRQLAAEQGKKDLVAKADQLSASFAAGKPLADPAPY